MENHYCNIEKAVASNFFEEIWVNSESDIIGKIARSCGVKKFPQAIFLRNSSDNFEDMSDIEFLFKASRLLRKGGKLLASTTRNNKRNII